MGLIPFAQRFIGGTSTRTVSARKLHEFLGSKRQFTDWIKRRIEQYEFTENQDYIEVIHKTVKNPTGGRPSTDYYLTLDMAKELAMVERTEKGREARRYFIDCEKQLIEKNSQPQLTDETTQPPQLPTPIDVEQRFLTVMKAGMITSMTPLPDTATIATPDNLPEITRQLLPNKALVDYAELKRLGTGFHLFEQNHKTGMAIIHEMEKELGRDLYHHHESINKQIA
jgi:phage anti-repressor protein